MYLKTTKKTTKEIIKPNLRVLLEEAKNAEYCRDIEESRRIFSSFWQDIKTDPDVSDFEAVVQAELLRLCGFFLSCYGRSQGKANYQLRGKDLLTKAIEIFEELDDLDKTAEARVMLALCYWYEGEIEECESILQFTEEEFKENQLHPVYLQIRLNRLMTLHWKKDYQKAVEIIEELEIPMELCQDLRLKTMYHNQAGIFYRLLGKYDKAVFNQNEAIRFARRLKSSRFIATSLNNLALLYMQMSDFKTAHSHIEEAISIFENLNDTGWIPHALDTKALLLNKENRCEEALETIESAISYFTKGDDYSGLVDAFWTKIQSLLRLDRKSEALILFSELATLASQRIGEYAVQKYADLLADLLYAGKNLPLADEVKSYKKQLVSQSLRQNNASVTDAASELGISHQSLSEILRNQFPELREEFGLNNRMRRDSKIISKKTKPAAKNKTKKSREQEARKITPIDLSRSEIAFENFDLSDNDEIFTFIAPSHTLKQFGVSGDAIICVVKQNFQPGQPFVICERENTVYDCGIAAVDDLTGYFYLICEDDEPKPFSSNEFFSIGRVAGFCLLESISDHQVTFKSLKL
ncbi:MAG: tetratricopeptide repeat protein [Acidobacteria bacterium]|jgi:tetratricopeptide (TPR) repeat protein|nr:tetratricopeptide repeat protein [Acidobacteriota bacterium]